MFCTGCGKPAGECDGTCRRLLDPPRYCPTCGRSLDVQVTPTGFRASCRRHGDPAQSAPHGNKTPGEAENGPGGQQNRGGEGE